MPSFDIVSNVDLQEVDNAVNQTRKEIETRYDFKGSKSEVFWDHKEIFIISEDEYKLAALKDILQSKMHKRGIDIQSLNFDKPFSSGHQMIKQNIKILQGIDRENSKKIISAIKESKLKVQSQIEGDKIRVSSKSIDLLRECMAICKKENFGIPIQFDNLR